MRAEPGTDPLHRGWISDTVAVAAADTADPVAWSAVTRRLRAGVPHHQLVVGFAGGAAQVSEALLAGAGGWVFAPPSPVPAQVTRSARPRWYRVTAEDGSTSRLSAREVDVLQGVADGHSLPRIGRELGLSTVTVRNHVTRAGHRLGARSRAHLVLLALRSGALR